MNEELQDVLAQMEPLLAELQDCPAETFATRRRLPNRGVYAFYESDRIVPRQLYLPVGVNQFCRFTSLAWPRCWAALVR